MEPKMPIIVRKYYFKEKMSFTRLNLLLAEHKIKFAQGYAGSSLVKDTLTQEEILGSKSHGELG